MTDPSFVGFRAGPALRRRLDQLAQARGLNRSAAIRAAILEATLKDGEPAVAGEHEVLELLGEAARSGNVAAMKELRAYHRDRKPADGDHLLDELDELARRRGDGVGGTSE